MSPLSAVNRRINILELNARVDQMERKHVEMQLKYDDMERRYSQLRDEHNNEKFGSMSRMQPAIAKAEEALSHVKQNQSDMQAFQKRYTAQFTRWRNRWSEMTRLLGNLDHMNTPSGRRHFERVALFAHNIGRTVHGLCNEATQLRQRMDHHLSLLGGEMQRTDKEMFGVSWVPPFDIYAFENSADPSLPVLSHAAAYSTPPPPSTSAQPPRTPTREQSAQTGHSVNAPQRSLTFD